MSDQESTFVFTTMFWWGAFILLMSLTGCASRSLEYQVAIRECEEHLPRDQHCEITAQIIKEINDDK